MIIKIIIALISQSQCPTTEIFHLRVIFVMRKEQQSSNILKIHYFHTLKKEREKRNERNHTQVFSKLKKKIIKPFREKVSPA